MTYSINDVIALLGLGRTTVYKMISEGRLRRVKVDARTLIPAADVKALIATGQA